MDQENSQKMIHLLNFSVSFLPEFASPAVVSISKKIREKWSKNEESGRNRDVLEFFGEFLIKICFSLTIKPPWNRPPSTPYSLKSAAKQTITIISTGKLVDRISTNHGRWKPTKPPPLSTFPFHLPLSPSLPIFAAPFLEFMVGGLPTAPPCTALFLSQQKSSCQMLLDLAPRRQS